MSSTGEIRLMGIETDADGYYQCPVCFYVNRIAVQPYAEGTVIHGGNDLHTWEPYNRV